MVHYNPGSGESALAASEQGVVSSLKSHDYSGAASEVNAYRQQSGNGQLSTNDRQSFDTYLHDNGFPKLDIVDAKVGGKDQSFIVSQQGEQAAAAIAAAVHADSSGNISGAATADKIVAALQKGDSSHPDLFHADLSYINALLSDANLPKFTQKNGAYSLDGQTTTAPTTADAPPATPGQPGPAATPDAGTPGTSQAGTPRGSDGGTGGTATPGAAAPSDGTQSNIPAGSANLGPLTGNVQGLEQMLIKEKGDTPAQAKQAAEVAQTLYKFLTSKSVGLTPDAAAGIIGNMAQESVLNPESTGSGGGGLIGWTPLKAGLVTDNVQKDLGAQEKALLSYINSDVTVNGTPGSVSDINAHATSVTAAADYFMNNYEKPYAPSENSSFREGVASTAAQAFA